MYRHRCTQHPTNAAGQQPRKGVMRALGDTDDVCSLADIIYINIELLYGYRYAYKSLWMIAQSKTFAH